MPVNLADLILEWYQTHSRKLPWRENSDPYAVLVSEIMLQQTRVETVIPYYLRWMERFPDLSRLASASQEEVLAAWEGLGYYQRARGLHKAARLIMAEYSGEVPSQVKVLRRLPSIGRYTAGAIASIAYGKDEPALDGNIRRVLARVFNVSEPVRSPAGERILWRLVSENLPAGRAGEYNQALMDLGAIICTPRRPDCPRCPLASICQARALGIQEQRPVVPARKEIPHYTVTAAVIGRDGTVLIAQRPEKGLLGGLWEFPGGKLQEGESLPEGLKREIMEELAVEVEIGAELGIYRHAYTHFRVTLHAFECRLERGEPRALEASDIKWVSLPDLIAYPMGKIDRQIARDIQP
jgi:A/G-specific adenine glycosylase